MQATFREAYTELRRGSVVYIVDDGALHFFRSPGAANAKFPGAFDVPDDETE